MKIFIEFLIFLNFLSGSSCVSINHDQKNSFDEIKRNLLKNNDATKQLLSEKELKLIRFISYLTYMQTTATNLTWKGWEKNYDGSQLDLDAIRYPLAHIGYTAAALAHRTPNYRELAIKILKDTIERMLTIEVWGYIDHYWKKAATFPDPVSYENIMYSGHLLQLLTLYESISGDFRYDTDGFDFIWNKTDYPITKIHYTTTKLAYVIYDQMNKESSAGVSCEPGWIYTICQNHPHLGFRLYDLVHNNSRKFSQISSKWKEYLKTHALEDIPLYKKDRYFKMLYQRETHIWVPFFASTGNDGWNLAWMSSWFDYNETSNFICDGWKIMYNNQYWKPSENSTLPGCFLDSGGYIGVRMQLNSWVATSFYPIVEKQCSLEATEKLNCTYSWFENNFGTLLDTDNDHYFESYYYETNTFYSNWVTSNILLSLLMGENGYNTRSFLRTIYNSKFYEKFLNNEPEVLLVEYPSIRVTRAQYDSSTKSLLINFNTEKSMILSTIFQIKYPNSLFSISNITRDNYSDGFTVNQISNGIIEIQYTYNTIDKQETEFNILFH
ncbi:unnamed protein product [Rotaria magnacalcarata]